MARMLTPNRRRARLATVFGAGLLAIIPGSASGGSTWASVDLPHLSAGRHATTRAPLIVVGRLSRVPHDAQDLGPLRSARVLDFGLALRPRDAAGLAAYAHAVTNPSSSLFHRYLSPAAVAADFGPSTRSIDAVARALRTAGLRVGTASTNHFLLPVSGSVARIDAVFHTQLSGYRLASGRLAWAPTLAPALDRAAAQPVAAVLGLDDLVVPRALGLSSSAVPAVPERSALVTARTTAKSVPSACPTAVRDGILSGGWTESQIAQAYGLSRLYAGGDLGAGQTIALYELEPFALADLATFERCYLGVSRTGLVSKVPVDGFGLSGPGTGEAILDAEVLTALAPLAKLVVYEAPNTTYGAVDEFNAIVSQDRANIVSTSWGTCETTLQISSPGVQQLENYLFEEAAAQGQTFFAASGDDGSDDCASTPYGSSSPVAPQLSVDDPASQPFVVGVGGTSLTNAAQPPTETAWNDGSAAGAGGGGISLTWPSPGWQSASGVPGVQAGANRQVPDVSASADEYRGVTVFSSQFGTSSSSARPGAIASSSGWSTIGGTSEAAPIWAAIAAEIAASPSCTTAPVRAGAPDLGFISPLLYSVASSPSGYAASFSDITTGNNDVFGLGHGYAAGPGYDLATGLGSPVVTGPGGRPGLAAALCGLATGSGGVPSPPVVTGLSPSAGPVTGGTTVTVHGSGFPAATPSSVHVDFGATPATVLSVSATDIVVSAPLAPVTPSSASFAGAGPVDVLVTSRTAAGLVSSSPGPAAVYDYVDVTSPGASSPAAAADVTPVVTGVGPSGARATGGVTVTVYGAGFVLGGPLQSVSFGGVPASGVVVRSDHELTAVVPPEGSTTTCATGRGFLSQTVCQVQVVVTGPGGASPTATILPPLSGPITLTPGGFVAPTPFTEVAPAASEFDYASPPTITSVSPDPANAAGTTPVVVTGTGFDILTLEWVNIGTRSDPNHEQTQWSEISPTTIIVLPTSGQGSGATAVPGGVSVQSAAGLSNVVPFAYAGTPAVRRLSRLGGPSTGGTTLTITGTALASVKAVAFVSELTGSGTGGSVSAIVQRAADQRLVIVTPADLPGPVDVIPCTATGCARPDPVHDTFVFFDASAPTLLSAKPLSGPAHGGTTVTLFGNNLDGALAVRFGAEPATIIRKTGSFPDGDPFVLSVKSAPGPAGRSEPITVFTHAGRASLRGRGFAYRPSSPSSPRRVNVRVSVDGAVVTWTSPASDGGRAVSSYVIEAASPGAASVTATVGARSRSWHLGGLVSGGNYVVRVAARNALGRSRWRSVQAVAVGYSTAGYRVVTSGGVVLGYGSLPTLGGIGGIRLASPVVDAVATPDGLGYWLLQSDGTVSSFGDAGNFGFGPMASAAVAMAVTPVGQGYWVLDRSGEVDAFGDAPRLRPPSDVAGASPAVGILADATGRGYFIAHASGAVVATGDARTLPPSGVVPGGGAGAAVALVGTPDSRGYWIVFAGGRIAAFGSARVRPGASVAAHGPVVGLAPTFDGAGYWIVTASGAVFAYGDARFEGGGLGSATGSAVAIATN